MRNIAVQVAEELDLTDADALKTAFIVYDDLSDIQNAYVYWRCLGFSPYQAAKKAGYASNWSRRGLENEANARISAIIEQHHNEASVKFNINRDRILEGLFETLAVAREQSDPKEMRETWMAIASMSGNDQPSVHEIKVSGEVKVTKASIAEASESELLDILGRERRIPQIIEDAEYAEVTTAKERSKEG